MVPVAFRLAAMTTTSNQTGLVALLEWYRAMGADAATSEMAVDWLARGDAPGGLVFKAPVQVSDPIRVERPQPPAAGRLPASAASASPEQDRALVPSVPPRATPQNSSISGDSSTRPAAQQAANLSDLSAILAKFDGCALKATAKNLCFYRGAAQARLMLIGEAPGRDEDIEGKPFVGRAGQLLDKMLGSIGLGEESVHITNIVYWRPPGNRTPTPQEAEACRPFLERQVELVAPDIIVALGGAAAKAVMGEAEGIMRLRGRWRDTQIGSHKARIVATLHPAYLLRTPAAKRLVWRDLLAIKAALGG